MRLRNKPWAVKLVSDHPEAVLQDPDPEQPIAWNSRFSHPDQPLEIEIGSGKGRFITTLAAQHPRRNYVAIELQTTAAGIILRTKLEQNLTNLQILRGDAAQLVHFFPAASAAVIYLNFSDPWPKARHEKRRLTYASFLAAYQQILRPTGHLEFKTDNSGLFAYSLQSFNQYGANFDFVSVDLHHESAERVATNIETEYEHKFAVKGHPIYALHASFEPK
ncbi:MAG: tRNA (guanosine(46)-N7)-methyltransferase TrmB [Lactobacillus sp.]|nr:tRNA (guanosine(46)-N7)-methyltransferase TrmB [Lactobacillus sp.]MDN6051964.1 tRNA (guanosine(46)-N7)-methyltransferase TrmB [Lactobacillus sp.]